MFLCLSLETEKFLNIDYFYGFKNFRILGFNLGIIFLLPLAIRYILLLVSANKPKLNNRFPKLIKFKRLIYIMAGSGIILGIINNIILNDNNMTNMDGYFYEYISISYNMAVIPVLLIINFLYIVQYEKESILYIKDAIIAILCGTSVSIIISLITNNYGSIGGIADTTLVVSLIVFYIPFLIIAPFYKGSNYKIGQRNIMLFFGIVGTIIALGYNANGKMILMVLILPFFFFLFALRMKRYKTVMLLLIVATIGLIIIMIFGFNVGGNWLLSSKIDQVISMVKFWKPNWLRNMSISPKYRIAEFLNICVEYLKKPWLVFFGKGYLGSITDHIDMFIRVGGDFTDAQWRNGTFYLLHESLNLLFLNNGIFGLYVWLYVLNIMLQNIHKSFYLLFGCSWFILTYGYSVTISALGMISILIGLYEIDEKRQKTEMREQR